MCLLMVPEKVFTDAAYAKQFEDFWANQKRDQRMGTSNPVEEEKQVDKTFLQLVKGETSS